MVKRYTRSVEYEDSLKFFISRRWGEECVIFGVMKITYKLQRMGV